MARAKSGPVLQLWSDRISASLAELELKFGGNENILDPDLTFLQWVDQLIADGLKVDGRLFTFERRGALRQVYAMVPNTAAEARNFMLAIMKGAQTGLTIWEILVCVWFTLKFSPCTVGTYVPDRTLAAMKSSLRVLPIIRAIPDAYRRLRDAAAVNASGGKEGNVLTRVIGASKLLFLWTSGKLATESFPMDFVTFDEVQEMTPQEIEKTSERLSASLYKGRLIFSTAKYPDMDIDYWYRRGTKLRFHTRCNCLDGVVLDDDAVFPRCIVWNDGRYKGAPEQQYVYVCPTCDTYIEDTNNGVFVAEDPDKKYPSLHFPQTLSATVSAGEMYMAWSTASDMENFFQRKLGRPFIDPSKVPVTMAHLTECVRAGLSIGLQWKDTAKGTFMGIDQMGQFNVVLIKERLPDGRQACIHAEMIFDPNPFLRCDDLMRQYGVAVCVCEQLPNYNDAKRFAQRFKGRVFLVSSYKVPENDPIVWGDSRLNRQDRKTDEAERDEHTVSLDQYKNMQVSMMRLVKTQCLFPDPQRLLQDIPDNDKLGAPTKRVAIVQDRVFLHFTKTALVTEPANDEENKLRRKVVKVGLDPHFSYANMMCDVAWSRAHGTGTFIFPDSDNESSKVEKMLETGKNPLPVHLRDLPPGELCGRCSSFDPGRGFCREREMLVRAQDPGCPVFDRSTEYDLNQ